MRPSSTSVILELVNVLVPLRQSQGPRQMRFLPLTGTVVPAPEARLPRAFAFQGRFFCGGGAASALLTLRALGRSAPDASTKGPSVLRAGIDAAMGQCRGRTHIPMALCQPRRQRPCRRDRNEQACRPIYPNGPRHGRLEVECGRSAGGSPLAVGGWPRGTIGSLGADCLHCTRV
jgi:hypothetical protein